MDIETLRQLGGIVSPTPVEREVTWQPRDEEGSPRGEPVTFTVRIRRLSAGMSERLWVRDDAGKSNGDATKADRSSQAALLAASLYLGDRLFTYEEAYQLDPKLATEFIKRVNEVNGWGVGAAAKNSQPPTNSGAT